MSPLVCTREVFRVDIRSHSSGDLIRKIDVIELKHLMHPYNRYPMRTLEMAHCRVPTSAHDTDHPLIVIMEGDFATLTENGIPNSKRPDPEIAKSIVCRNDLCLRRGV